MKQILQSLRNGETALESVPVPQVSAGSVLVRTRRSLVSLGSERTLVEFGRAGILAKVRQQPEKVKVVLDKMRSDGVLPTLEAVFHKLDEPIPLGYCNVGEVVAVGAGVKDLRVGDRLASNGPHAEYVCVPRHLAAPVPDSVSDEEATFTVIGSIALQGVRLVRPELGETVVVVGLGLVGLLAAQLLRLSGCRVIGYDFDANKVNLAKSFGIDAFVAGGESNPVARVMNSTGGVGADAVVITASTRSNTVIAESARMSRKRGRIVLVGVVGLEINRSDFYEKELTFQVSCSYGPGRYDEDYEQKGLDYPLPYVRWTENRNFQAILGMLADRRLEVTPMISEVVALEEYDRIYNDLGGGKIASLLRYPDNANPATVIRLTRTGGYPDHGGVAVVGAGNFTRMTVLPGLKKVGSTPVSIVSAKGVSGTGLAKKYGIPQSTTVYEDVLKDSGVAGVIITTRHDLHAEMALAALKAGKHVLVEKPMCLNWKELAEITRFYQDVSDGRWDMEDGETGSAAPSRQSPIPNQGTTHQEPRTKDHAPSTQIPTLSVGYNRRFSPFVQRMKALLGPETGPMNIVLSMNAGAIPRDSWVHDPEVGGGRILGEACHYIDLAIYLSGSEVEEVMMSALGPGADATTDNASITLRMANGSHAVIHYFANGHKSFSKERIEVFSGNRILLLDNFRRLTAYGFRRFSKMKGRQDKGHAEQFKRFCEGIERGTEPLIPLSEIINSTATALSALDSLAEDRWVRPKDQLADALRETTASS
ncbi:MAG: bi-domain-containing oxidoreductase [Opitutales bacterium]|nr:bi-domain-containing oxidoreductase [Opitutales bacterium]